MNNDITLNDLQTVVNIIDVCTKRGAFEGGELLPVGQLREKFATYIKSVTAKDEEANTTEVKTEEVAE